MFVNDPKAILTFSQLLSITCDNATVNDSMVDIMGDALPKFPGEANRTRCFAHILNLAAKTITKLFDLPAGSRSAKEDELIALAGDIELEELQTQQLNGEEEATKDNIEGWVDEEAILNEEEKESLSESILPVRVVIVKVCLMGNS